MNEKSTGAINHPDPMASSDGKRRNEERSLRTRKLILEAAYAEFSARGLGGARVDEIARQAGINKRMLYHHYGNKDALFLAVMEEAYRRIRTYESGLSLEALDAETGMRALVGATFDYFIEHPEFITLLNDENMHRARHIERSEKVQEMHSPLVRMIADLLDRGRRDGIFHDHCDPIELYISIAALGYFYFSNIHTLSTIFGRDLRTANEVRTRREHVIEVIMGYLRA